MLRDASMPAPPGAYLCFRQHVPQRSNDEIHFANLHPVWPGMVIAKLHPMNRSRNPRSATSFRYEILWEVPNFWVDFFLVLRGGMVDLLPDSTFAHGVGNFYF